MEKVFNKTLKILLMVLVIFMVFSFTSKISAYYTSGLRAGDKLKFTGTSWAVYSTQTDASNFKNVKSYLKKGEQITILAISGNVLKIASNKYIYYGSTASKYFTKVSSSSSSSSSGSSKKVVNYTITYYDNDANKKTTPFNSTDSKVKLESITKTGYTLKGYATTKGSTTVSYKVGQTINNPATTFKSIIKFNNVNLYAVWTENTYTKQNQNTNKYTLTFNKNADGTVSNMPTSIKETKIVIPKTVPKRTGYTFIYWCTTQTTQYRTAKTYKPGATIKISKNTELYAIWGKTYLTFNKNLDGTVSNMPTNLSGEVHSNSISAKIANKTPTKSGYRFLYWCTAPSAQYRTAKSYKPGDTIVIKGSMTLYAIWEKIASVNSIKLDKTSITLTEGTKSKITAKIYAANGSEIKGKNITYSSKNESIAKVDGNGNITARKAGNTEIVAKSDSKSIKCVVNVIKRYYEGNVSKTYYSEFKSNRKTWESNARYVYNRLIKAGATPEGAAGAVGNITQECRWNKNTYAKTDGVTNEYGTFYGMCMWGYGRGKNLIKKKNWTTISVQTDFMINELKTSYTGVWKTLTSTHDVIIASNKFQNSFEICGSATKQRQEFSIDWYNYFNGITKY